VHVIILITTITIIIITIITCNVSNSGAGDEACGRQNIDYEENENESETFPR